jgi:hypothetical protein
MADWVTISSLATAGGTLVLAVATFSSVIWIGRLLAGALVGSRPRRGRKQADGAGG